VKDGRASAFNTPLEAGVRSVCVLTAAYPRALDLPSLVNLDYVVVHSGDLGGPPSLHAPVPLRSGEILVRRGLVESGLLLMISRGLVDRAIRDDGVFYRATDSAGPFVANLATPYNCQLRDRAAWAASEFGDLEADEVSRRLRRLFDSWAPQFQAVQEPGALI
jgi:hypothetical protein